MNFEKINSEAINEYIQNNPNAKLSKTHSVILKGVSTDLQVYNIPLKNLVYNIKNYYFNNF